MVTAMVSPWPSTRYAGGTTAFPLLVPVTPVHREAAGMRAVRQFLSGWQRPTLLLYSQSSLLPWLRHGDFVVGRRLEFYQQLVPGVVRAARLGGGSGHLVMWDSPGRVAAEILSFIENY